MKCLDEGGYVWAGKTRVDLAILLSKTVGTLPTYEYHVFQLDSTDPQKRAVAFLANLPLTRPPLSSVYSLDTARIKEFISICKMAEMVSLSVAHKQRPLRNAMMKLMLPNVPMPADRNALFITG